LVCRQPWPLHQDGRVFNNGWLNVSIEQRMFFKLSSPDQGKQARLGGEIIPHKHDAEYLRKIYVRNWYGSLGASLVRMRMGVN
jgi:hypothetical protein